MHPFTKLIKINQSKDKQMGCHYKKSTNKRVLFSASATLEGTLVIPLYMYAVLTVIYVLQMLSIQATMAMAMQETVRELAKEAYVLQHTSEKQTGEEKRGGGMYTILTSVYARQKLMHHLPDNFVENSRLEHGFMGISLLGSSFMQQDNRIVLCVSYRLRNPFDIFSIGNTWVRQKSVGGAWLGEDFIKKREQKTHEEKLCYITFHGAVYHLDENCTYLKPTVYTVGKEEVLHRRNASGGKYYACEHCRIRGISVFLYVTDYGNRYHTDRNCSNIAHEYEVKKVSEVPYMHACSKCGHGKEGE